MGVSGPCAPYQERVKPDEDLLDIKGKKYSLRDAMRDETFDQECLVIGIFMTMYDVHVNRVPFAGTLCYKELEPIGTNNMPMIEIEKSLIDKLKIDNGILETLVRGPGLQGGRPTPAAAGGRALRSLPTLYRGL